MSKICTKCGEEKPPERFSRRGEKYKSSCKDCHNKYVRETWYVNNRERHVKSVAAWKKNNRASVRASEYGVTKQVIEELWARGCCDICGRSDLKLHIDHCHESNNIRGILCERCNHGLGHFKDSIDNLESAIVYLKNSMPG